MMLSRLLYIISFFIFPNNAQRSPLGTEQVLRRDIKQLYKNELQFSSNRLPYAKDELSDMTPENNSKYDFIVIGAGTAGSVIASRLSEIETVTVLLIEAGGAEYSIVDIPTMAIPLQYNHQLNWGYETERTDEYCLSLKGQRCVWPRGKVMGGSSTINSMLATRGNRRDYDEWANMTGDDSWSYKNILQYLKKLENFDVRNAVVESEFHNKNGSIHVTGPPRRTELTDAFIQAGEKLNYSEVDYNGLEQIGFSYFQSFIYEGERWSNNRAYLRPAKGRKNLILTQNSHVHKILINKLNKKAYGVRYSKKNIIYQVKARKEIILCAGTVNSPQILMLSGVGPSKHLSELNIDVIKDAPVGENLIDHVAYTGFVFKTNISFDSDELSLTDLKNPEIKNYLKSRTGKLSLGLSLGGEAYVNVDDANNLHPNMELLFIPNAGLKDPSFELVLGISDEYKKLLQVEKASANSWTMWPIVIKPYSRGKILLGSKNPFDKPKIFVNYFKDRRDVEVMIKGMKMVIELSNTIGFQKLGSQMYDIPLTTCDIHKKDSDAYWECAARTYTTTMYHPVGTCKMGQINDSSSIVDPQLKVIGIEGLRVVDASIMPDVVSAHTNIPTTVIAEKGSDMIKKDYNL